ncbi:ABC transporter permease [Candidatus Poribacteria bacterium]|nr:ABC transporter permease [Candidatus Poribacteria bacterium]
MPPALGNDPAPMSVESAHALPPADDRAFEELPVTVFSADERTRLVQTLKDLWAYRELSRAFLVRDIKVRYKQTALGIIWVVLQPLLSSGLFALIFKKLGAMADASAMDTVLFFMAGMVPWNCFAQGVTTSSSSMESSANIIRKIYFPRLIVPATYVAGTLVDFTIAFTVFVILSAVAGKFTLFLPLAAPFLVLIMVMSALGLGFFLGALNAQYHDVKYVIPFALMMGMLITVLLPLERYSPWAQQILSFNPMAAVIETLRALLADKPVAWLLLAKGCLVSSSALVVGVWFFRKREARILDIL